MPPVELSVRLTTKGEQPFTALQVKDDLTFPYDVRVAKRRVYRQNCFMTIFYLSAFTELTFQSPDTKECKKQGNFCDIMRLSVCDNPNFVLASFYPLGCCNDY